MRVRYTPRAIRDLDAIRNYVAERAPEAAARVGSGIEEQIALLEAHPYAGRAAPNTNIRSLTITRYPYIVFYRLDRYAIAIMHIRHQRRAPFGQMTP